MNYPKPDMTAIRAATAALIKATVPVRAALAALEVTNLRSEK